MINTLSNDKSLVDYIVDGLRSTKSANQNGRMYASTSGFCERQTALGMTYTGDVVLEPETELYFKMGLAIEDAFIGSLKKQGLLLFTQFETPDIGLNIGGKIDGIYCLPDGKIRLLEIKSCGQLPKVPYGENISQANLYSAITGLPIDLVYGSRLVKQGKSDEILIKEFRIPYNPVNLKRTMFRVVYGKICADKGLMPDIPDHIHNEFDCGFCKFKNICWQGEPSHLETMSDSEIKENWDLTEKKVLVMMSENAIEQRRNGVLKHLSQFGTDYAKRLLVGTTWDKLV